MNMVLGARSRFFISRRALYSVALMFAVSCGSADLTRDGLSTPSADSSLTDLISPSSASANALPKLNEVDTDAATPQGAADLPPGFLLVGSDGLLVGQPANSHQTVEVSAIRTEMEGCTCFVHAAIGIIWS
jgi:hypothetical protein